jgi:hypothetical protein
VFDIGVRAVAADAVGVEQTDAKHEVGHRLRGMDVHAQGQTIAGVEDVRRLTALVQQLDAINLDLA